MAHRYLVDDDLAGVVVGGSVVLGAAESRHAVTVSRLRQRETIEVGDGRGTVVVGVVRTAAADAVVVVVDEVRHEPVRTPSLELVQALAKGDRDELALQAATELGVDRVVPWAAARSVVKWTAAKAPSRVERWRGIAREAAKQSLRARIPEIGPLVDLPALSVIAGEPGVRLLVLDTGATEPLVAAALAAPADRVVLVVGPEGGVAPAERDALVAAGATAVRLGPEVLRTSTAGPAAIAALSVALERWT